LSSNTNNIADIIYLDLNIGKCYIFSLKDVARSINCHTIRLSMLSHNGIEVFRGITILSKNSCAHNNKYNFFYLEISVLSNN